MADTTSPPPKPRAKRSLTTNLYPGDEHRDEIVARTNAGETCEQIAAALRAQGVTITQKTVSKRRLAWGLRQRPVHKLAGTHLAVPRPRKDGTVNGGEKLQVDKEDVVARMERGETAEEIAAALTARGVKLVRGKSSVLRLQTYWGLIPPDPARARGRKKKVVEVEGWGERERERRRVERAGGVHYPVGCENGPKKRGKGVVGGGKVGGDVDGSMAMDDMDGIVDPQLNDAAAVGSVTDGISVAAELMSVDFLVDLANSTLSAANDLKQMLLAYQAGAPAPNSMTGLPPTLDDLAVARRKVREAAAVMHDLAADPVP